jgi:cephalosporin hydroxylase
MTDYSYMRSDKYYWHRYIEEYERLVFSRLRPSRIVEFGVLHGDSIAALAKRFHQAEIVGVDILPEQPSWPKSEKIRYFQVDQANADDMAGLFRQIGPCDLVVEDGSHIPEHQAICLRIGWPWVTPGGWYILEDIHTSHPNNANWKHHTLQGCANALHVLLALEHLKATDRRVTAEMASALSGFFEPNEIFDLSRTIANLYLFRRGLLPLRCYKCQQSDFDYVSLRCRCGVDLYAETDSMTCLLQKIC